MQLLLQAANGASPCTQFFLLLPSNFRLDVLILLNQEAGKYVYELYPIKGRCNTKDQRFTYKTYSLRCDGGDDDGGDGGDDDGGEDAEGGEGG